MYISITLCNMFAIITACIFDLLVLNDLIMHILFYNKHQQHELEYKEKIHYILLVVLNGLCILMYFLNACYIQM